MSTIWKKTPTLDELNQRGKNTINEALGIRFVEVGEDYLEAILPVDHRTHQPAGLLHGGASAVLAETLGSVASVLSVDPRTAQCVGIEINANHLRSVRSGEVRGRVTPLHVGKSLHVWQIEIRNPEGQLICTSRLTVFVKALHEK